MNSEKREAAAQVSEQTEGAFLRIWTSHESEKQDTAEYLGCGCDIAAR